MKITPRIAETMREAETPEHRAFVANKIREMKPRWRAAHISPRYYAEPLLHPDAAPLLDIVKTMHDSNTRTSFVARFAPSYRGSPLRVLHLLARVLMVEGYPVYCASFSEVVRGVRELETLPGSFSLSDVAMHRGRRHLVIADFMHHPEDFAPGDVRAALDWLYMHCVDGDAGLTLGLSGALHEWPGAAGDPFHDSYLGDLLTNLGKFQTVRFS